MPRVGDGSGFGKGPPKKSSDKILEEGPSGGNPGGPAEKDGLRSAPVKGGKKK